MKYISDFITLKFNKNKCIGCGLCKTVCPHRVFDLQNKKAFIKNINNCIECGACMSNCPSNAITVTAGVGCANAILGNNKYCC